nr:hypothetical protein [Clostridia bacterium]
MNKLSPNKIVKELKNNNLYILTSIIIIIMLCLVIIPFPFIFVNSSNKILSPIFEIFDPDSDEYIIITWEYNSRHGYYNYQYIFSDNEKNIDELESLDLRKSISQTNKAIIERNYGYLYFRVKSSISEYSNWINMYVEQKQLNKPNIHYLNGINSNIIIDPVTYYNYSTKRPEYVSTYSYYFSIEGQE